MKPTIERTQLLPRLDSGLTRLETPSTRSDALHAVVVDALVESAGETLWIDARHNASTYVLHGFVPNERALRTLRIARAFTAYQHHTLVTEARRQASRTTDLVVVPCVADFYRDTDLPDYRRAHLLESAMVVLHELGTTFDLPVVVTDPGPNDDLGGIVDRYVDHHIGCVKTALGYRFETDGFQTTVYWCEGFWQTTVPYWIDVLGAVDTYERAITTADDLRAYVAA